MNPKIKKMVKAVVPQALINIARGAKQRVSSGFSPVVKDISMPNTFCCLTDDKSDYVGGYYDITPFSADGSKYLMLKLTGSNSAEVVLYNIAAQTRTVINQTNAVNRQQGARLRWVQGSMEEYYFNDYIDGKYVCVRANINCPEKVVVGPAFYDISEQRRIGVALNFARLGNKRAGYGYLTSQYIEQIADELLGEGIDLCDLDSKNIFRPITYRDLISISGWDEKNIHRFYINHICLSPSGTKFTFFWIDAMDSDSNLKAMLFVYDIEQGTLKLLEDTNRVSHYAWKNNDEILVTVLDEKHACTYISYHVGTGRQTTIPIDGLTVDGHPSWLDDRVFITDTYPDHHGYQTLYVVDSQTGQKRALIRMYHSNRCIGEMRCDMHPRLSPDKSQIAFDGNIHGVRNVYMIQTERL